MSTSDTGHEGGSAVAKIVEFWRYTERTAYENTLAKRVLEPVVDFVVRTGEIIFLAAAFQSAANATHSKGLRVAAFIMAFALALHFGLGWGRAVLLPLSGTTFRARPLEWVVVIALGLGLGLLQWAIWQEISEVAKAIAVLPKA